MLGISMKYAYRKFSLLSQKCIEYHSFTVSTHDGIFTEPLKTKCREYKITLHCAQCTVFPTQDRNF